MIISFLVFWWSSFVRLSTHRTFFGWPLTNILNIFIIWECRRFTSFALSCFSFEQYLACVWQAITICSRSTHIDELPKITCRMIDSSSTKSLCSVSVISSIPFEDQSILYIHKPSKKYQSISRWLHVIRTRVENTLWFYCLSLLIGTSFQPNISFS